MKLIIAMLRSEKLEAVERVLQAYDACLLCVSQVAGSAARTGSYRGADYRARVSRLRLEIAVDEGSVESLLREIVKAAAGETRGINDCVVCVMPLDECICNETSWTAHESEPALAGRY